MKRLLFLALLALASTSVRAQATAEEIAFWETVRNSTSAVELQAYIDRYPNGAFVPIARARLAALGAKPAATPAPARQAAPTPAVPVAAATRAGPPQPGDTWTYRLSYPKRFGVPLPNPSTRTYVIKVGSVSDKAIVDQLSIDGGAPSETTHTSGAYLLPQGMSIYSPYLEALNGAVAGARLGGGIDIQDPSCSTTYRCEANARVYGQEQITVPAGQFLATKLVVNESWRPASSSSGNQFNSAQFNGGRTLTVWYSPQVKRVVKYQSRKTVGDIPAVEPDFDLELVSYKLQ